MVTNSARTDYEELAEIQERLAERDCVPASHYADSGYLSGSNLANSQAQGIDLIGPLAPVITPQDRIPNGITWEQFDIDLQNGLATCPGGHSIEKSYQNERVIRFKFPDKTCQACSLRSRCCTGKGGRTLSVSPFYEHLRAARARQETEDFKQDNHKHRSGVEGSLSGVVIFVVFIIQKAQTFLLSFRVKRGIPGILLCLIIAWFQGFFTPLRCVQNDTYSIGFCKTPSFRPLPFVCPDPWEWIACFAICWATQTTFTGSIYWMCGQFATRG